jgi:periplasmic protein TonB
LESCNTNPAAVTDKDRPKLPLLVLAAGGILLGAAALQSVLITVPGPSSNGPHAISVDGRRPAGVPAPSPASSSSPAAEPADPTMTGAVPDPPAGHAIDPASPPSPPEPASVGAEHPADASPKDEPQSAAVPAPAATEPEGGPDTGAPGKVESTGSKTLTEPHEPTAEALKVETPPAESKPSPQAVPSQLAIAPEKADPAPAPSPPEIKAVAAEPKVETVPAQSKPVVEPEPTQVVKSETVEETPVPAQAPSSPEIKQAAAEANAPKPGPTPVAESKPEMKPEPKAAPAEKPKETAAAEAQGTSTAKHMSLGFGRKPAPAAGKVSSGRYAANVRAAIGRHRPGVRGGGSATVAFSIGPAGGLQGVQIVRSSGKPALDQAAIATVRSAAPFPPPPAGVKSTFSIQIYFR